MNVQLPYYHPCPQDAVPGLLGKIGKSLIMAGLPAEMVIPQVIAVVSFLTQAIADVAWPNEIKIPIGANVYLVANSGMGKTMIRNILMTLAYQRIESYNLNCEPSDQIDLIVEDLTPESLLEHLAEFSIIAIHSDEAGKLSRLKSAASTLIGVIDGAPTIKKRVTKGKLRVSGQRACIFLMEQPEIFEATKATMKMRNGGDGVINRCLASQFSGCVEGNALHQAKLLPEIQTAYEVKVTHFVDETLARAKSKNSERPTIKLSPQAAQFLIAHGNDVRSQCVEGFQWFHISEYATRHAERVLRLAGAFHVFEYGVEGEISLDTIQRAATLGIWYIEEFARMMHEPPKVTQADLDVTTLENAILSVVHQTGVSKYRQSVLRACAANLGLTPARFNRALAVLGGQGKIKVIVERNTPWVIFQNHYSSRLY